MEITNFDQWLDTLESALDKAKSMGMPQKIIEKSAANLAIAGAMIKMVEKRRVH